MAMVRLAMEIRNRFVSPVELLDDMLQRIESDPNAPTVFTELYVESARRRAEAAEDEILCGRYRGPLHGVAVVVDERAVSTSGERTLQMLDDAGAILLGLTSAGKSRETRLAGEAAASSVAEKWCQAALGKDVCGELRLSAAKHHLVSMKPTAGLVAVPEDRRWITCSSFGPVTRSVRDNAQLLNVFVPSTQDFGRLIGHHLTNLKLGVPEAAWRETSRAVQDLVSMSLYDLALRGVELVPLTLPDLSKWFQDFETITNCESYFLEHLDQRANRVHRQADPSEILDIGELIRGYEYLDSLRNRMNALSAIDAMFATVDVVILPAMPPSLSFTERTSADDLNKSFHHSSTRYTAPFSFTGHPALTLPLECSDGEAVSIQLVSSYHSERRLYQVAAALES